MLLLPTGGKSANTREFTPFRDLAEHEPTAYRQHER